MSNNNHKQPLDLSESLPVSDKAHAPFTTTVNVGDVDLGIPEINQVAAVRILESWQSYKQVNTYAEV